MMRPLFSILLYLAILLSGFPSWSQELPVVQGAEASAPAAIDAEQVPVPESAPYHAPVSDPLQLKLNIPAARLDLYRQDQLIKSYSVAIGQRAYPTPVRDYTISMIIWNPWWIPPDSEWAKDAEKTPPGPTNPLGIVKMIMEDGVRIHGTNQASSIGRAMSHACIRMLNKDAKELAWEIQSRYSEKTDPTLLETYKKHRNITYYVPLFESVPVTVEYRQVERKADQLLLHPNRYALDGFAEQLAEALSDHPDVVIDKTLLKKLNKMRARKSVQVPVEEIMSWTKPSEPTTAAPAA